MRCICTIPNKEMAPLIARTAEKPKNTLVAIEKRIPHILSREGARAPGDRVQLGGMRRALLLAGLALAASAERRGGGGPAGGPGARAGARAVPPPRRPGGGAHPRRSEPGGRGA